MRLGVLASGSGSNFGAIQAAIAQGDLAATIPIVIYNNPGAKVQSRAAAAGIATQLLNHRDYPQRADLDQAIVATLQAQAVDYVVMAGWMRRVTPVLIDHYPQKIFNIHPSLLPSFPGMHAVEQALNYGVKVTGCTVHWVIPEVDAGPIIAQAAVPVLPGDTPATLQARIQVAEHDLYPRAIAQVLGAGHQSG